MGKGRQTATQTQIQDVPDWARPYYEDLLASSSALSQEGYVPYGGQRIANDNADLTASQGMVRDIAGNPIAGFGEAAGAFSGLGADAQTLGQQAPGQFNATGASQFDFGEARQFDGGEAARYMSPYMDAVVSRQQDDAYEQFLRAQGGRNAQAVNAGAFGGSRQAVQEGIAEESLMRQMGDIQARGLQDAFSQAQTQFGADREAQMTTAQRQAAEQGRVQGIDVSEQARVQGATADEAMRQREFQLQSMGFTADMAREIASLGERARAGDIQAAQLLEAQGLAGMARDQAGLDIGYEDFLRQQNFPREQLEFQSAILRGMPVGDAGTTTTMQPYNPMQQALGAGISAVGLYNGLRG